MRIQTPVGFPNERSNLAPALSELGLKGRYPAIVLIGGEIDKQQVDATSVTILINGGEVSRKDI